MLAWHGALPQDRSRRGRTGCVSRYDQRSRSRVVAIHSIADRVYDGKTERNAAGRARDGARHLVKLLARQSYMNAAHVSLAGCV